MLMQPQVPDIITSNKIHHNHIRIVTDSRIPLNINTNVAIIIYSLDIYNISYAFS